MYDYDTSGLGWLAAENGYAAGTRILYLWIFWKEKKAMESGNTGSQQKGKIYYLF